MATIKKDLVARYQTTKDGDIEETQFSAGSPVTIVQTWDKHYLIRDEDGHYYNLPKDSIEP